MEQRLGAWLSDGELELLSRRWPPDQGLMAQRYEANCPSDWYRGYATVMVTLLKSVLSAGSPSRVKQLIDAVDRSVKRATGGQSVLGAGYATTNASLFATGARSVDQLSRALEADLICVAQCFGINRRKGI